MNLNGLVLMKRVDGNVRKAIGKNEYFPLSKMYTGEEVTISQIGHVTVTTTTSNAPKQISKKSEISCIVLANTTCKCTQTRAQASWSILL